MKSLTEILKFYGMPDGNIDMAITQIAQGYGAIRFLEGVSIGAESVCGPDKAEELMIKVKRIVYGALQSEQST